MVKIKRLPAPQELTSDIVEELTLEYELNNKTYGRKNILRISYWKCHIINVVIANVK